MCVCVGLEVSFVETKKLLLGRVQHGRWKLFPRLHNSWRGVDFVTFFCFFVRNSSVTLLVSLWENAYSYCCEIFRVDVNGSEIMPLNFGRNWTNKTRTLGNM